MNDKELAKYWNKNALGWTALSRLGRDVYRDYINTPGFLKMLPKVKGLKGLDVGCGEGHNTRLVAKRGAKMKAVDIARNFILAARGSEKGKPLGINYCVASGHKLPFRKAEFDFVVSFMALMDMGDHARVLRQVHRVLKPGGFFQFSIIHPCFAPPYHKLLRDKKGMEYAIEVGRYFEEIDGYVEEWIFSMSTEEEKKKYPKFKVPYFHRTLSTWLNMLIDGGFVIERVGEPYADKKTIKKCSDVRDTRVGAYFLHVRCRKPV